MIFPLLTIFSLVVKLCHSTGNNYLRKNNGQIAISSDRMITTPMDHSFLEDALRRKLLAGKISRKQYWEELDTFTLNHQLDTPQGKIMRFQGPKEGKEYALGFNGDYRVRDRFETLAFQGGFGTVNELAKGLDRGYREADGERGAQEFMATDGKEIYGIKVGRKGHPGLMDRLANTFWPSGQQQMPPGQLPPQVRKMKGNVLATGWETENMQNIMKPIYGGKRPAQRTDEEMRADLKRLYEKHSRHLTNPNTVSATFDTLLFNGEGKAPKEFSNISPGEKLRLDKMHGEHQMGRIREQLKKSGASHSKLWNNGFKKERPFDLENSENIAPLEWSFVQGNQPLEWRNVRREQLMNWQREPNERMNVWGKPKLRERADSVDMGMFERVRRPADFVQPKLLQRHDSGYDLRFAGQNVRPAPSTPNEMPIVKRRPNYRNLWHKLRQIFG